MDEHKSQREQDAVNDRLAQRGLRRSDSNNVTWDAEHGDFPRNWSIARKLYDGILIFFLEFYTTVISTTGPSAAEQAMEEYGLSRVEALTGFQFTYGIGQAIGGLIMPPFSESLGRRNSYLFSASIYSISSLITGVVPSPAGVCIGRFLSGYASSVPSIVLAGSIEDLYTSQTRLWFLWLWNCCTSFGLCVGPIYGSYIVSSIGWRWIYYTSAIATVILFVLLLAVRESRPTKLLVRRFGAIQSEIGSIDAEVHNPDKLDDKRKLAQVILVRPARLGLTEPIVILVSLISALAWGLIYLFTESFSVVYAQFGWSDQATSLPFIALLPGVLCSGLVRLWDHHRLTKQFRRKEPSEPEDKIGGFALAAPGLAIGLWIYAWTVPPLVHVHWIASMFGLALIGFATNEFLFTLSGYIADSYTIYAASALAAQSFLRGIASAVMPLFAYQMYAGLGSNVATSTIAAVATFFCVTPFIFLKYGQRLRERSQFAMHSARVSKEQSAD